MKMKKILALAAMCMAAIVASQALAATQHHAHATTKTKTLTVAMRDPGCHWFLVHGKYTKSATVAGSVRLLNQDEKTLKVTSGRVVKFIPVGKSLVVNHGRYVVTMVHQASDDNHLKLTVR